LRERIKPDNNYESRMRITFVNIILQAVLICEELEPFSGTNIT